MLDGRFDPEMARLFQESKGDGGRMTIFPPGFLQALHRVMCRIWRVK